MAEAGAKERIAPGWAATSFADPAIDTTVCTMAPGTRTMRPMAAGTEWRIRRRTDGGCSKLCGGGSGWATISGVRSSSEVIMSPPAEPSIRAWWTLVTRATVPSAKPSTSHVCQSGTSRRSGWAHTSPTNSLEVLGAGVAAEVVEEQVVAEVELVVLDPAGVVEPGGHLDQLAAERGDEVEPLAVEPHEAVTRELALGRRRVEHQHAHDVEVHRGRLQLEERGVHPGHSLDHRRSSRCSHPAAHAGLCSAAVSLAQR